MNDPGPLAFVWIDAEATHVDRSNALLKAAGLDTRIDILEVAAIFTDVDLNELGRYTTLIRPGVHSLEKIAADPFVEKMHTVNGLLLELQSPWSTELPTTADVDRDIAAMVAALADPEQEAPKIAGGGVANYDWPLIKDQMPTLAAALHYRPHDVSIISDWYRSRFGELPYRKSGSKAHRALADIEDELGLARALKAAPAPRTPSTAFGETDRVLAAVAMVEAFIHQPAGTSMVGSDLASLTSTVPDLDAIAGLIDLGAHLTRTFAAATGMSSDEVLHIVRQQATGGTASADYRA